MAARGSPEPGSGPSPDRDPGDPVGDVGVEVRLLLFASAREAAGRRADTFRSTTLAALLEAARERYGSRFGAVLDGARIWVDGDEPVDGASTRLREGAEVAVLPPVSGG